MELSLKNQIAEAAEKTRPRLEKALFSNLNVCRGENPRRAIGKIIAKTSVQLIG